MRYRINKGFWYALHAAMCLWAWPEGDAAGFDRQSYCAGVYHCLGEKSPACTRELCEQRSGNAYSTDFCALFVELRRWGLEPASLWGRRIFARLGQRYRVTYEARGTIPLPLEAVQFLLHDIPFAAGLINAYEGTQYVAQYTGSPCRQFWGSNGSGMQGTFSTVLQNPERVRLAFFGHGRAEVLLWSLSGLALVLLECEPADTGAVAYRFRSVVFPESRWVQTVLDFILFRRAVIKSVQDIIGSIERAAGAFARSGMAPGRRFGPLADAPDQKTFEAFLALLNQHKRPGP